MATIVTQPGTVIVQPQAPQVPVVVQATTQSSGQWTNGLCGCCNSCGTCLCTCICPCWTYGNIAEGLGKNCCCHCCIFNIPIVGCICAITQRGEVRYARGIPGSCIGDCCTYCCCPLCALVQEAQEVRVMRSQPQTAYAVVTAQPR